MLKSMLEGTYWQHNVFGHAADVLCHLAETPCPFDGTFLYVPTPRTFWGPLFWLQSELSAVISHFLSAHRACWAPFWCVLCCPSNAETHKVLRAYLDGTKTGREIIDALYPHFARCVCCIDTSAAPQPSLLWISNFRLILACSSTKQG